MLGIALLVALAIAGWFFLAAVHFARLARLAAAEAHATRQALVDAMLRAADEQTAKESALRLLDAQTRLRRSDLEMLAAELDAMKHEYRRVQQLYRDAIGVDAQALARRVN